MAHHIGALDRDTTSTRFMVFDRAGHEIGRHQLEHRQIQPRPGAEHDPAEIGEDTLKAVAGALADTGLDRVSVGRPVWRRE
ncbi:FGGY family carbohydrate kinase [Actinoplanes sp. NPDC049802]|uniref:FGGY family carbohydrate kinase n=1 Tax=Actinoplanes sp. NPDC049802 TaxID=3154742 RepID=UPI0033DF06A7